MRARPMNHQWGGDTVEFALILPMMLLVFAVLLEVGVAFVDKAIITDASRAAARAAISGGTDAEARAAAEAVLASGIPWGGSAYQCSGATCAIDRSAGTDPGDPIGATLVFPFQYRIVPAFLLGEVANINITGRTVMRVLEN